jgi:chemotaxis protein histidine kinase CheA
MNHKDTMTSKPVPSPANITYTRAKCVCNKEACLRLTREFQKLQDYRGDFLQVPTVNRSSTHKDQKKNKIVEFERIMKIFGRPNSAFANKRFLAVHHYNPTVVVLLLCNGRIPKERCVKVDELQRFGLWGTDYSEEDQSESDKQHGLCRILPTYSLGAAKTDLDEICFGRGKAISCKPTTNRQNVLHSMMPTMPVLQNTVNNTMPVLQNTYNNTMPVLQNTVNNTMPFLQNMVNNINVHQHYWSGNPCGQNRMNFNELRHENLQNNNYEKEEALNRLKELKVVNATVKELKEELKTAKEAATHEKEEATKRLKELRNVNAAVNEELKVAKEAAAHEKEEALNTLKELKAYNATVKEELKMAKEAAAHEKEEALNRLKELQDVNAAVKEELKAVKEAAVHEIDTKDKELQVLVETNHNLQQHLEKANAEVERQKQQLSLLQDRYHVEEKKRTDNWLKQYVIDFPRVVFSPMEEYWLQLPLHHPLAVITERISPEKKDETWTGGTPRFEETEENKATLIQLRSLFFTETDGMFFQDVPNLPNRVQLIRKFFLAIHPRNQNLVAMSFSHFKMGKNAFHPDISHGNPALEYMRARLASYVEPVIDEAVSPFSATNQLAKELSDAITDFKQKVIAKEEWIKKRDMYVETNMATNEAPGVVDLSQEDSEDEGVGLQKDGEDEGMADVDI